MRKVFRGLQNGGLLLRRYGASRGILTQWVQAKLAVWDVLTVNECRSVVPATEWTGHWNVPDIQSERLFASAALPHGQKG